MHIWNKKVNAGALQYVLVIAIIILIILFSLVQLISLQSKLALKNTLYKEAILNVTNGFRYLSEENFQYDKTIKLKLSDNEKEETFLIKKRWGIFDIVTVQSKVNKEVFKKTALIGNRIKKDKAVYLAENNMPLVLVGNSIIVGNAYLPKQGIKRGSIAGVSFYGNTLVNGTIYRSSTTLLQSNRIQKLEENNDLIETLTNNFELEEGVKTIQSFNEQTLYYSNYETLKLENITLKGNIIVVSNSKIIITKEAILEDIIIKAPEIEIQSGAKGNFQAFASKKITVGNKVTLNYPSLLAVNYNAEKIEENHGILIKENTVVKGGVLFIKKETKETNYFPQIRIEEKTKIVGEVFCRGNTELLGEVIGEINTKNFITRKFGSVYVNHIYNGHINRLQLPEQYVGFGFNSEQKSISKWLY